jgi:hypothetical protein
MPNPTAVTPVDGATLLTNQPVLGATITPSGSTRYRIDWQLATDSAFTQNVRTVSQSTSNVRTSGPVTMTVPTAQRLNQTTWFLRARQVDEAGVLGAWTTAQSFVVSHQPAAVPVSPSNADTVDTNAAKVFTWQFSDPSSDDLQTSYQIVVEKNADGSTVLDTGKTSSSNQTATLTISSANANQLLRWRVWVWDTDNVQSAASVYSLFQISAAPVVTITSPAGTGSITSGKPTISWSVNGNDQDTYQIKFFQTSNNSLVFDSGVIDSSATTYTPAYTVLQNSTQYRVECTVVDVLGLSGTGTFTFTTNFQAPSTAQFTVDAIGFTQNGYVNITWTGMTADTAFKQWRVYRRELGKAWVLVYSTTNPLTRTFHDWMPLSNKSYQWTVTQIATRNGQDSESPLVSDGNTYALVNTAYWLLDPNNENNNTRVDNVTGDSYSVGREREELIIIDRGRKVNYGTKTGIAGQLTIQVRGTDPTEQLQNILTLADLGTALMMRDPFGNITQVDVSEPNVTRIAGVSTAEFVDVSLNYAEVA